MIIEYFIYKKNQVEKLLSSDMISPSKKQQIYEEYTKWLQENFKQDSSGRIIVNKKVAEELIKLLHEGKIPAIMNGYDRVIVVDTDMPNSRNYQSNPFRSIKDLVAIHKTAISPQDDTIYTPEHTGRLNDICFTDPSTKKQHSTSYVVGNDTIHFTLNCPVENHDVGNDWDSYKYAVMIRLDKLDKAKIPDVKSEDTYVDGNAELGKEYYIFCPLGEKSKIQKANPHATIIEYDGISLNEAISRMIIYSGYKLERYGSYGWERHLEFSKKSDDEKLLEELLKKEQYPNLKGPYGSLMHSESKYMARRMWKREYEAIIALIEYNIENNIDMPLPAMMEILKICNAYSLPGSVPVTLETFKEYVIPILEKHGYHVDDALFENLTNPEKGTKLIYRAPSPIYGIMMPVVNCPEWETELRNRIIDLIKSEKLSKKRNQSKN